MATYSFTKCQGYEMVDPKQQPDKEADDPKPFFAPCNTLDFFAPLRWLSLGWQDYKKAKLASIIYGTAVVLISYIVFLVSWRYESIILAIAMLSAFIFIAPVLCIGLYSLSRQLKSQQKVALYKSIDHGYARGDEPVQYVDNIRRYYETLQWITDEAEADLENESSKQLLVEKNNNFDHSNNPRTDNKQPAEEAQTEN